MCALIRGGLTLFLFYKKESLRYPLGRSIIKEGKSPQAPLSITRASKSQSPLNPCEPFESMSTLWCHKRPFESASTRSLHECPLKAWEHVEPHTCLFVARAPVQLHRCPMHMLPIVLRSCINPTKAMRSPQKSKHHTKVSLETLLQVPIQQHHVVPTTP